ncbi:MAG: ABC transporter, CydDC cysteine exporter (CydDC-E) family, permease/ATP-binding protein CydD, partial [Veillonella dispar DORA_11]
MTECPIYPRLVNQNNWHKYKGYTSHQSQRISRVSCISNRDLNLFEFIYLNRFTVEDSMIQRTAFKALLEHKG